MRCRKSANLLWVSLLFGSIQFPALAAHPLCERSASDPDGDGYGWENGDTCRVADSSVTPASSGLPVCLSALSDSDGDGFGWESGNSCRISVFPAQVADKPFCLAAGSDSDGDGFGWENGRSCIVNPSPVTPVQSGPVQSGPVQSGPVQSGPVQNGQLAEEKITLRLPACSDQRFDPDGDGYGWENSSSCTFLNSGDSSSITEVVLVTGQSNALGAETLPYNPFDAELDSPVRRVYAFSQNGWGIAGLRQIWDRGWYPRSDIGGEPANNFAFHFGKSLVRKEPDTVVGLIMVTAPGAGINHWDRDAGFFQQIDNRVRSALSQLPGDVKVSGVLWHQGETDNYSTDYYSDRLRALIGNFRAQSWFADDGVFICGETLSSPVNERLVALNSDGDSSTGCALASDLESIGDGVHFNAPSLRVLGARYTDIYQILAR